eukprot:604007-Prymnesium_polylepis.1
MNYNPYLWRLRYLWAGEAMARASTVSASCRAVARTAAARPCGDVSRGLIMSLIAAAQRRAAAQGG